MKQGSVLFILFFTVSALFAQAQQTAVDGTVVPDEYPQSSSFADGSYVLSWRVEGDTAVFAMEAATSGWVAVGFDPLRAMDQADMVFGWIDGDGQLQIVDAFSLGPTGPHPPDDSLGGTADIIEAAGREENGRTVIEFSRALTAQDQYDKPIPENGDMTLIVAYGATDDFNAYHRFAGGGRITTGSGTAPGTARTTEGEARTETAGEVARSTLVLAHALFLSLGFALMTAGIAVARYYRRKRWWMKAHRPLGVAGAVMSVIGFVIGFIMVSTTTGIHFRVLHSIFGMITLIVILATPILGHRVLTGKTRSRALRKVHRWSGRIAVSLMLVTILLGMFQAGLF